MDFHEKTKQEEKKRGEAETLQNRAKKPIVLHLVCRKIRHKETRFQKPLLKLRNRKWPTVRGTSHHLQRRDPGGS